MPEAEELFDLWIYRPAAYLLVRPLAGTPVTPDHLTYLSLAASLAAAWLFASGSIDGFIIGGFWYAVANVLDCADGQLARLRGGGSPHGRLIDGGCDYIGSIAIFAGIGFGLSSIGMGAWVFVIAAAASSALHAMVFDNRQAAFIAARRRQADPLEREIDEVTRELESKHVRPSLLMAMFLKLHLSYLLGQRRVVALLRTSGTLRLETSATAVQLTDPELDATLMRLWSYLGPTTNRTVLIASALIGRLDLFLWFTVVIANLWLILMVLLDRRASGA